ncbi:MAG TPA: hypothetical protein VN814_14160 [Caulobacteraceae bacterium]|nr:hypothetical protein [Caulobacteraceae bacterium]
MATIMTHHMAIMSAHLARTHWAASGAAGAMVIAGMPDIAAGCAEGAAICDAPAPSPAPDAV